MPSEYMGADQVLDLTLQATRREIAPVLRYQASNWETEEHKGTYSIPTSGGLIITIEGHEGQWWVSGKAILEAILRGVAAGALRDVTRATTDPMCVCEHPLSVHTRDGFASCEAPDCACGPGCIHDGFVAKDTGEGAPASHSAAGISRREGQHVD